jgi:hypothetical protein
MAGRMTGETALRNLAMAGRPVHSLDRYPESN